MTRLQRLHSLKEQLAQYQAHTPEPLMYQRVNRGIFKGRITQIYGAAKTSLTLDFLKQYEAMQVFWVETSFTLYPPHLAQIGLDLNRFTFSESPTQTAWTCLEALRSNAFDAVVVHTPQFSLPHLQRLQLSCEKAANILIWLSDQPSSQWPVKTRIDSTPYQDDLSHLH